MREGEQFLHQQDSELHISEPVEHEKERKERRSEETSQKPAEKIADWLELLKETHTGHRDNPEVAERIKQYYHQEYVIKPDQVPESAFLLEQRIARELGHGDVEMTQEFRERKTEQIINDQTQSLDKWLDYLTSKDADVYPMWAKYWAFTSMVKMGKLEKKEDKEGNETARFQKRTEDTVSAFPPLNPRALAMTFGVIAERAQEKQKPKKERKSTNKSVKLDEKQFQELLSTENFSKIYSQFLIEMPEYSTEGLKETRGKWIKYDQGSDPKKLVKSLEGHPLEWCTANPDTARTQLEGGDFYVYYSLSKDDKPEKPSIPRLAMRMEGDKIAEVRGIAHDQNIDPYIADVAEKKLKDFPDGEQYKKKSADMRQLTEIEKKTETKQELTKEELRFLYEVNGTIEGFGYHKDPRIQEIRDKRNVKEDLPVIFECQLDQIAFTKEDIKQDTVAYIGEWTPDVMNLLPGDIEHVYEKSMEGKVFWKTIETNPSIKSAEDAEIALKKAAFRMSDYAKNVMLKKVEFSGEKKEYEVVSFSVESLGFPNGAKLKDIFARAKEFSLELCPAEFGPQLRLQYTDQPNNEYLRIAMEPIIGSGGVLSVLGLDRGRGGLWLDSDVGGGSPESVWNAGDRFVFVRSQKNENEKNK